MMQQKVLVTGATGFIGSQLVRVLHERGDEVTAFMRTTSNTRNLDPKTYQRVEGTLEDLGSLKRAVAHAEVVFHLAGVVSAPDPETFIKNNTQGTRNLVEAILSSGSKVKLFVFVSSLAAGGPAPHFDPRREEDPELPVSTYGRSKLAAEKELLKFRDRLKVIIVRPPVVYGPRDRGIYSVVKGISKRIAPVLRGGNQTKQKYYSMIHVNDLCSGLIRVMEKEKDLESGELFYLTGDESVSLNEAIRTISENLEKRPLKIPVSPSVVRFGGFVAEWISKLTGKPLPFNRDKVNELLPDYWVCSSQKAKEQLGFQPKYPFSAGMKDTVQWYRENKWL